MKIDKSYSNTINIDDNATNILQAKIYYLLLYKAKMTSFKVVFYL